MAYGVNEVRQYVLAKLGRGVIRVELTEEQLTTALKDAVKLYNRFAPPKRRNVFTVTNGRVVLSTTYPTIQEVIDVVGIRNRAESGSNRVDLFDPLVTIPYGQATTDGLAAYMQSLESLETARRLYNAEVEWHADWEHNSTTQEQEFAVYIDTPNDVSMIYGYECIISVTPDDNPVSGIGAAVHRSMRDWLDRCTLAYSKQILGLIRRKFQGIPSPDGSDMQLDGVELVTDAENELNTLQDEIVQSRTSMPFIIQ